MSEPKPPVPIPAAVTVIDVQMPFWSMVVFMVKWAIAAIPAVLILVIVGVGLAAIFRALLFASKPEYLKWMIRAQRFLPLRI